MKLLAIILLLLLYFAGISQTGHHSSIEVKGNSNTVKVIQGNTVNLYDLNDEKQYQRFLNYLQLLPGIQHDIKKILAYNKKILELVTQEEVLNTQLFIKTIDDYIRVNERLKVENELLRKQSTDPAFTKALEEANKKLQEYDNKSYQAILQDFKLQKKSRMMQAQKEYGTAAYLQASNSYNNYYFDTALVQIDEALAFEEAVNYILLKAKILDQLLQYDNCLQLYRKVAAITTDDSILAVTYLFMARAWCGKPDLDSALEFSLKALVINELLFGIESPVTADTYRTIGWIYSDKGDYYKALRYYEKDLAITEKQFGQSDPNTALSYYSIGAAYMNKGDYNKSLAFHQKALAIFEKEYGTTSLKAGESYNQLGLIYHDLKDYDKALEFYEKALAIREKINGKDHPGTAIGYNNIGMVYLDKKEYSKALGLCEKALSIHKTKLDEQHPLIATSYFLIGSIYQAMGDYDKALAYDSASLVIKEKVYGKVHPNIANVYHNIGSIYSNKGDHAKSLEYYFKARDQLEKIYGKDHPNEGICYTNIGSVYEKKGEYDIALAYYNKNLAIQEKVFGKDHSNTHEALMDIGLAYVLKGNLNTAMNYFNRASCGAFDKVYFVYETGMSYAKKQKFTEALNLSLAVEKLLEQADSTKTVYLWIAATENLAKAYCLTGQKEKALSSFEKALVLAKDLKADDKTVAEIKKYYDACAK